MRPRSDERIRAEHRLPSASELAIVTVQEHTVISKDANARTASESEANARAEMRERLHGYLRSLSRPPTHATTACSMQGMGPRLNHPARHSTI